MERHFFLFMDFHQEEWMDEIIRGDFAKYCGLLNLAEVQRNYQCRRRKV
jgi:hypothetical protein